MSKYNLEETIANIEVALNKLKSDLKDEVEKAYERAYERGWDDGLVKKVDHTAFHEAHLEPQWYGEDGEVLVLSGKHTFTKAVQLFKKALKSDLDPEYYKEIKDNIHSERISLAVDGDECSYYASRHREGIFNAWVWRLQ